LFIALALFQLAPLPPALLRTLSPQTYEFYTQVLPGWPERVPYGESDFEFRNSDFEFSNATSASGEEARNPQSEIRNSKYGGLLPQTWLPLSLAPFLSKIDLLKFAAYAALFFLIWLYPFQQPFADFEFRNSDFGFFILSPEQRFLRSVVVGILLTGLLVAAVGFIQRFTWN